MTQIEPVAFGTHPPLHGIATFPSSSGRIGRGVVFCGPLGHDDIGTYRPLRTLASRLADVGIPSLRFDWPGAGDSGDSAIGESTHDLLAATPAAIAELRARADVEDVVVVAARIGALFGLLGALDDPGVSGVALLGPQLSGRAYLRELRLFQAMAVEALSEPPHPVEPLPAGAVEASGYLIAAPDVKWLQATDLTGVDLSALEGRRAFVGVAQADRGADRLVERLSESRVHVSHVHLPELSHVWDSANVSVMPPTCSSAVVDWVDADRPRPSRGASHRVAGRRSEPLTLGGAISEQTHLVDGPRGRLLVVTCEPSTAHQAGTWIVFLNAGKVRRCGPNRLATTMARRWARRGVPSLRVDLHGIGDSDGDDLNDEIYGPYDASWFTQPEFSDDLRSILSWLAEARSAAAFAFIGLCSGAMLAFQEALANERVVAAGLLNPRIFFWDDRADALSGWDELRSTLARPRTWSRLAQPGARTWVRAARHGLALKLSGRGNERWHRADLLAGLDQLAARQARIRTIYSGGDLGLRYLERHLGPDYRSTLGRHGMPVVIVEGTDHTFRPLWSHAVLVAELEHLLTSAGVLVDTIGR
jgi:alpha/beta superfamily hydrolase